MKILALFLLTALLQAANAQTVSNAPAQDLPLIPEDAKLLNESSLWQHTLSLRTGVGYQDNVLLSPAGAQGSAFLASGLDFPLSRLPLDRWGIDVNVSGDDQRYLQNVIPDGTDFWFADINAKRFLGDHWQAGLEATESYLDEVDYVDTLIGPAAVEIQGNALKLKPFVRREIGSNGWAELDFPSAREIFDGPLDDVWKFGPQVQVGVTVDQQRDFALSYQVQRFDHDSWPALSAIGAPIGTRNLSLVEQRAEVRWREFWGQDHHWSTDTKFTFAFDQDNGGQFFNFNEYSLSERLHYQVRAWDFSIALRGSYLDYPTQRTGLTSGPTLNEILLHATLHAEHRLTSWLKLYAEYNYERVLSNLSGIRYQANTVTMGLIWEF